MKPFTKISAVFFALVAVVHLIRLFTHFQLSIFGTELPVWVSAAAILVGSFMSWRVWTESNQ